MNSENGSHGSSHRRARLNTAATAIAPRVAPSPALIAPTIGFMLQGSYIGQLVGPMSAGALAQAGGWPLVVWMLLPLAIAGALLSRKL